MLGIAKLCTLRVENVTRDGE